ncbi:MAG: hypothetical protein ACOYU3_00740 [Bacillota bacterium]
MTRRRFFHWTPYILCFALLLLLPFADSFAAADGSVKSIRIDTGQAGSYSVWQEGAQMQLAQDGTHNGNTTLRADLIAPNGTTGTKSGSFYHILPENKRDWSQTECIKFWLKNASAQNLLLNFSFKEAASEDWGLGDAGTYFLQDADGMFYKSEYQYCNLEIPAQYEGYVIIPFSSLVVPGWSTAKGDHKQVLSNIETYAFGAQYSGTPQTFYLDDITVTSVPDCRVVCMQMTSDALEIPKQVPSQTWLGAFVTDLKGELTRDDVSFTLEEDYQGISLSKDGMLKVKTDATPADVQIKAAVDGKPQYFHRFTVHVVRDITAPLPAATLQAGHTAAAASDSSAAVPNTTPQETAVIIAAAVTVLILIAAIISAKASKKRNI